MKNQLNCPNCQSAIEITEVMAAQLSAQIRAEVENEVAAKRQEIEELGEQAQRREAELKSRSSGLEREISERMQGERKRLRAEAEEVVREALQEKLTSSEQEMTQLRLRLKESQKAELDLEKNRRELEDRAETLELEVARQLNMERSQIRKRALEDADEQHRLNAAEKDSQIQDLVKKIDELKRKAEQGSQQTQGEVQELALEELLASAYPWDTLEPVAKGVHGGDAAQRVTDATGLECGAILWESKRTKNWNKAWLAKARENQRVARAQCVVVVSETLPDDVRTFALVDGVWVCSWSCVLGLAAALRTGMIEVGKSRLSVQGQIEKKELVYAYLSSSEFRQRIEGMVEAYITMQAELDAEKRAMQRIWSKRDKQLHQLLSNTAGLYGDVQGIIGKSMPTIVGLALPETESVAADTDPVLIN